MKQGVFIDPRDQQEYKTVELLGKTWLAQNLNFDVGEECWFYNDDPKNGEKYGRLYTWPAAIKACPEGWYIPTSKEWEDLANAYGGYRAYEDRMWVDKGDPKNAYKALIDEGSSGFAALLGGFHHNDGSFFNLKWGGYYWSSTEKDSDHAWYYRFDNINSELYRHSNYKTIALSVRFVKNK